jgi:predicted ABC-type ATPase
VAEKRRIARIYVLAGVNGAGKSSVGGSKFAEVGQEFFNPDLAARKILSKSVGITQEEANAQAWLEGRRLLERAITTGFDFAFETTLGGDTITRLLMRAAQSGAEVRIWYVGLETVEKHIERVKKRVASGGHDIPEAKIRERYDRSRLNLLSLIPYLTELRLFDNTAEYDAKKGRWPEPVLLMHCRGGRIIHLHQLNDMAEWAKPVVQGMIDFGKSD